MKETLINALIRSGTLLMNSHKSNSLINYKQGNDIVTQADLLSEKTITDLILNQFPNHNILAEEGGELINDSEYTWVIDPLDGTKNYAAGLPYFCVSIGLLENNEPVLGGVYAPAINELYTAEKGKGTYFNGQKLSITPKLLRDSMIVIDFNHYSKSNKEKVINSLEEITNTFRSYRSLGSGALSLAQVSAGIIDAYVTLQSSKWDKIAGYLIAKEAGAIIHGSLESNEPIITVNNQSTYEHIINLLNINSLNII